MVKFLQQDSLLLPHRAAEFLLDTVYHQSHPSGVSWDGVIWTVNGMIKPDCRPGPQY